MIMILILILTLNLFALVLSMKIIDHNALISSRLYNIFNVSYTFQIVESDFSYTATSDIFNTLTITPTIVFNNNPSVPNGAIKKNFVYKTTTELLLQFLLTQGHVLKFNYIILAKVHRD